MKRFFLLFFLIVTVYTHAQSPTIYIKTLSTLDGLSNNRIKGIFQDAKGFMWFYSKNTLNRYDGYHFKTIVPDTSIDMEINVIKDINNKSGDLLIGTSRGVYVFNQVTQKIESLRWWNEDTTLLQADKRVNTMYADSADVFWLGSSNALIRLDLNARTHKKYNLQKMINLSSDKDCTVFAIYKQTGCLWLGTNRGLYRFDISTNQIHSEINFSGRNPKITQIKMDTTGYLWLAVYNRGLVRFDPVLKQAKTILFSEGSRKGKFISDFILSPNNTLWVTFYENGLYRLNKKSKLLVQIKSHEPTGAALLRDRVNTIFLDRAGTAWIGTEQTGIGYFKSEGISFINYNLAASNKLQIWSVYKEADTIWFGFINRDGLLRYNLKTHALKTFLLFPRKQVRPGIIKILKKDNDHFWVITQKKGVFLFNKQTEIFHKEKIIYGQDKELKMVITGFYDFKDRLWLSPSHGGIILFQPDRKKVSYFPLYYHTEQRRQMNGHIYSVYESANHTMYFGGSKGKLYRFDERTQNLTEEFSLGSGRLNSIFISKLGFIYVTTQHGLLEYNPVTKALKRYTHNDGFVTNRLFSLLPDGMGNLWISHIQGLSCFNIHTKKITNYNYWSGLANPAFNRHGCFRDEDGLLLFSNLSGITAFYPPEQTNWTPFKPDIQISEFDMKPEYKNLDSKRIFYEALYTGQRITLPYNSYIFMFDFFMTQFDKAQTNHFSYKLEGLNSEWQDLGPRHLITFLNLPPGGYNLRIKGKAIDGEWIEKKQSIHFEIQRPFWKSWWFWAGVILTVVLLAFLLVKLRIRAIRRRNRELEIINKQLNEQIRVRQQVEESLRTSESKYRTLVESIDEGILTIDRAGRLSFLNSKAASYFPNSPEDVSGRTIGEFFPPSFSDPLIETISRVIESGERQEINTEINQNGQLHYFHLTILPLTEKNVPVRLALCVWADTTSRVELEEKLRQAQKMEAIGNLAGGVAHDFNNLLSVIRGYSFLLLNDSNAKEDILESIREIDQASERAQTLTRQLLAFSRKQLMKPRILNINKLIEDLNKLVARLIGEDIRLELQLEPELKTVLADPGQLEQVLMNLVVNAKDAMPKGGRLTIRTENIASAKELANIREPNPGAYIGLYVTDTGEGMEKEVLNKIFDPFFTTKETGKGTGLGLSTVFGIIKQSDGYIHVDSTPGKGSTFSIYIPQVKQTAKEEKPTPKESVPKDGNKTILVIEDEKGVRSMITKTLKLYGYKSFTAENGVQGLEVFEAEKEHIDCILCDVVMPGMSGMEMIKRVQETAPELPAIFMSGYTDDEMIRHGIKEDGIHFLQKPFNPDDLVRLIRKILPG